MSLQQIHEALQKQYPQMIIRETLQLCDKLKKEGFITVEKATIITSSANKPDKTSYKDEYYISYEGRELVKMGGYKKSKKFNYEKWTFWIQVVVGTLIALIAVLLAIGKN